MLDCVPKTCFVKSAPPLVCIAACASGTSSARAKSAIRSSSRLRDDPGAVGARRVVLQGRAVASARRLGTDVAVVEVALEGLRRPLGRGAVAAAARALQEQLGA